CLGPLWSVTRGAVPFRSGMLALQFSTRPLHTARSGDRLVEGVRGSNGAVRCDDGTPKYNLSFKAKCIAPGVASCSFFSGEQFVQSLLVDGELDGSPFSMDMNADRLARVWVRCGHPVCVEIRGLDIRNQLVYREPISVDVMAV
ncbi:hypothetical protein EJB05_02307, partial [Eragrostis curvula]